MIIDKDVEVISEIVMMLWMVSMIQDTLDMKLISFRDSLRLQEV